MTESIRQQIVEKVIEELNSISVSNGYQNNSAAPDGSGWARRSHFAFAELPLPRCIVQILNESKREEGYNDRINGELLLAVNVIVEAGEDKDVERRLDSFLSDVEAAVNRDATHGDLAYETVTNDVDFSPDEDFPDVMAGAVTFRVFYEQKRTDPTQRPGVSS